LRLTSPFNLPAPGRRQPLYVVFDFAETCVFVKQSPYALHCGPLAGATLLPKLRVQFAEFLNKLSLERLWIFSSSTCVGLRYGSQRLSLEDFPGSVESAAYTHTGLLCASLLSTGGFASRHQLTRIDRHSHMTTCLSFCVSPSSNESWEVRNINRMSISYASRPRLRDRLTLSGLTFLRKP
jgi:hypothetical protein